MVAAHGVGLSLGTMGCHGDSPAWLSPTTRALPCQRPAECSMVVYRGAAQVLYLIQCRRGTQQAGKEAREGSSMTSRGGSTAAGSHRGFAGAAAWFTRKKAPSTVPGRAGSLCKSWQRGRRCGNPAGCQRGAIAFDFLLFAQQLSCGGGAGRGREIPAH